MTLGISILVDKTSEQLYQKIVSQIQTLTLHNIFTNKMNCSHKRIGNIRCLIQHFRCFFCHC